MPSETLSDRLREHAKNWFHETSTHYHLMREAESALDAARTEATRHVEARGTLEQKYRAHLWVNHGCPFGALYGDDGEMQCHGIDFKRMPLEDLERHLYERKLAALAAAEEEGQ